MFGEIVSREKAVLTISKGIVISQENVPIKKGSIEKKVTESNDVRRLLV